MKKTISVIGLGYIGLPTALILSDSNFHVNGFDIDNENIEQLKKGNLPFKEKGLNELFQKVRKQKRFFPSNFLVSADVYIIAVPTPVNVKNKLPVPNIRFVESAALSIAEHVKKNDLIIIESTVPVGTTKIISEIIFNKTGLSSEMVDYAYCPERVLPGNIINELKTNDRVIGGLNEKSALNASEIYSAFCEGELIKTNSSCAELVKLSENSFRDINIAFANELSILCEKLEIDIFEMISIANHHPRVNILNPGCGVGGHCIAVDPWFIVSSFPEESLLIRTAREVNNKKTLWVKDKILSIVKEFELINKNKPIIGFLGLAFKPNIDDLRESPALKIFNYLNEFNLEILPCEPNLETHSSIKLYSIKYIKSKADIILKLVDHKEFQNVQFINNKFYDFCR